MFTKFSFKAAFALGTFAIAIGFGLVSCNENNRQPQPQPPTANFETPIEIQDDYDPSNPNARTAAVENPMYYRFTAALPCSPETNLKVFYRIAETSPATFVTDSVRKTQKGVWKSFTVKPEFFNKVLAKKLDKTKSYSFYLVNPAQKRIKLRTTTQANPDPFFATWKALYTLSEIEFLCTDLSW